MNIVKTLFKPIRNKEIQKKILQRKEYNLRGISIGNLKNKEDAAFLKENIMPLATFARRNSLGLEFKNGEGLFDNQTVMDVARRSFGIKISGDLPIFVDKNR